MATAGQISTDASAWPHQLCLLCTTSGRTDICLLVQKSVSTRLLSSQFYYMQQKPGLLLLRTSKLWKPSTLSVRDSCCRSVGNSLYEMARSRRLPACHRSRTSSATVVAPSSVTSRDYNKMSWHTRPYTATSTCLSADHPTTSGNTAWADPESNGLTRSGKTTEFPRRTCGGVWRVVVTEEQHYGPRWLRDNDCECTHRPIGLVRRSRYYATRCSVFHCCPCPCKMGTVFVTCIWTSS